MRQKGQLTVRRESARALRSICLRTYRKKTGTEISIRLVSRWEMKIAKVRGLKEIRRMQSTKYQGD